MPAEPCGKTESGAILFAFFLLFLSLFFPAGVQAAACPAGADEQPAQLILTPVFEEPLLDLSLNVDDLTRILKRIEGQPTKLDLPTGVSTTHIVLTYRLETLNHDVKVAGRKRVCSRVRRLEIVYGFRASHTYILRHLPPGSCAYREVFLHEQRHTEIDRENLHLYRRLIEEELEPLLGQLGPVQAASEAKALEIMTAALEARAGEIHARFQRLRDRLQDRHDSEAEYRRIAEACNGDILARLRAAGYSLP